MKVPLHKERLLMLQPRRPWKALVLLSALLSVTACGTKTQSDTALLAKAPAEKQDACIVLPAPDFNDPTMWMKNYNVTWHRLGCDKP